MRVTTALTAAILGALLAARLAAAVGAPASMQLSARPPATRRNFVSCPIVRDTSTLPCWLAEWNGELYFLGSQGSTSSAFYPPQLKHEVLVEAAVGDGPRVCGGLPLRDVEVSVMPELNQSCNILLPAEPAFSAPVSPPAPIPAFADDTRAFVVLYDFDSDMLTLHTTRLVSEVARIAIKARPSSIDVRGERAATLLSNGQILTERSGIGEVRAQKMGEILIGLGLPASAIHVTSQSEPTPPDGATDATRRRVTIRVNP